jgi:hypothetical protein
MSAVRAALLRRRSRKRASQRYVGVLLLDRTSVE